MADPYDIMMGIPMQEGEDQLATARALRGQQNLGNLLSMTGFSRAQDLGQNLSGQALKKAAYLADMRQQELDRAEDQRRWQAEMGLKQQELSQQGQDWEKMPYQQQTGLSDAASSVEGLDHLISTFDDDYTGFMPGTQSASNWLASMGMGTDDMEEGQQWWAEYQRLYTLPQRNQMFGATLTPGEKAAWAEANLSENMTPAQIRRNLKFMRETAGKNMSRMRENALMMGANPYQVHALTRTRGAQPGKADVQVGTVQGDGEGGAYRFTGGDPGNSDNWEKVR